jgi:alpha-tubulin suppressor-like RCC1 family protein
MPNQFNSPEGDLENYFVSESWLIDQWVGDTLLTWGIDSFGHLGINIGPGNSRCTPVTTFAGGTDWKQVSTGTSNIVAIKTDGTLWTWGLNNYGQLGANLGNTLRCTPVTTFAGGTNWKQVSCGNYQTMAIKTDGTLWTWGLNNRGQLGINNAIQISTPVTTFAGGTNWKQVSCLTNTTAAIKTDGTLWTWGDNNLGQLGINNTTTPICTPVTTFAGGTNWKQVFGGSGLTAAIKTDGTLWTWGLNNLGQLGVNDTNTRCTPVTTFAGGTNWKQVSGGYYHIAAIKTDGTLWTWGLNNSGQLGVNNTTTPICTPVTTFAGGTNWKQVGSCGQVHTAAIKTDGSLWTWGANAFGGLGDNTSISRSTPVTTFAGGTNWKQVSCGSYNTSAVTSGTDPTYFIS